MSQSPPFNYVRMCMHRHGLSRIGLAKLVGYKSRKAINRIANGHRKPTLETAFALQIIFGFVPHELFPGIFERVEEGVMRRGQELHELLEGLDDSRSAAVRELLEAMPARQWSNAELL
jgi:transcriptional regulator with XRE-family HTH domain